jgi:hypothetical protein
LKERRCSCENNDLEKDVERGESWGYRGFLEDLVGISFIGCPLDSVLKIYQNMLGTMGYPNGVRNF